MDSRKEAVREYLKQGIPYRALAKKYNVSRSTINKWVLVHQGIHDIPRTHKQNTYDLQQKIFNRHLLRGDIIKYATCSNNF